MKKFLVLFLILFLLTIPGCKSVPKEKIELPPRPKRSELEMPQTIKDYALILNYYEHYARECELWMDTVEAMINE